MSLEGRGQLRGTDTGSEHVHTHGPALHPGLGRCPQGRGAHGGGVPAWGLQPETAGLPAMASSAGAGWSWVPVPTCTHAYTSPSWDFLPTSHLSVGSDTGVTGAALLARSATFFHRHSSPNPSVSPRSTQTCASVHGEPPVALLEAGSPQRHTPSLTSAPREQVLWALVTQTQPQAGPARPSGPLLQPGCCPQHGGDLSPASCPVATKWGVVRNAWGEWKVPVNPNLPRVLFC